MPTVFLSIPDANPSCVDASIAGARLFLCQRYHDVDALI